MNAVGVVPVAGRGSLPFALLHGESLVAVASWALGEAGVTLCDFDAAWSAVVGSGLPLVVHDPLCPATPVTFLARCVVEAEQADCVVAGVRPVTDTVKRYDDGVVGATVDRDELVVVASPVVLPPRVVRAAPDWPDLDDFASLVAALRDDSTRLVEAPATARRVADESDLRLLEAMAG